MYFTSRGANKLVLFSPSSLTGGSKGQQPTFVECSLYCIANRVRTRAAAQLRLETRHHPHTTINSNPGGGGEQISQRVHVILIFGTFEKFKNNCEIDWIKIFLLSLSLLSRWGGGGGGAMRERAINAF